MAGVPIGDDGGATVIRDPDFAAPGDPTASLFARAAQRSFFNHKLWYEVLAKTVFGLDHRVLLYANGTAALPVAAPLAPARARRLTSLANYYSCAHDIVCGDDPAEAGIAGLVRAIGYERPAWETLTLSALDEGGTAMTILAPALRRAGWSVRRTPDFGTWHEVTEGMSFAGYLAARPSSLRNTWRRKRAKLERAGRLRLRFHDGSADVETAIRDYDAIYGASWKGTEPFPLFTPALIRATASLGALRIGILDIDEVPAAAQLWIVWQGRATIFKLAHDARHDELSPGTVLTMAMFERVLEIDRPREIDFGRGDDPYKKLWLPRRRQLWTLEAANPRTVAGLKLAARHQMAPWVNRLRALRTPKR